MKKLILADSAGFCAGVDRSVKLAHKALEEFGSIICYGELIHNKAEVARLEAMGMTTVSDIEDIPESVREKLEFVPVENMDEVLKTALIQ